MGTQDTINQTQDTINQTQDTINKIQGITNLILGIASQTMAIGHQILVINNQVILDIRSQPHLVTSLIEARPVGSIKQQLTSQPQPHSLRVSNQSTLQHQATDLLNLNLVVRDIIQGSWAEVYPRIITLKYSFENLSGGCKFGFPFSVIFMYANI